MKPEIPGYTLIAELHRSPIAIIYRAVQNALERVVLVKMLQTNVSQDPEINARFLREAKACARLKHPHIVQIYDFGDVNGVPYFIMEYVEGTTLRERIARVGRLPLEAAVSILYQLLEALRYSHHQGVLHRDIKPTNILLFQEDFVKLADFGLAVFSHASHITTQGQIVGTPAYMSPEQARGEPLDERSDLFSVGVTFYEMLTGKQLFGGETIPESLQNLLHQPFPVQELVELPLPSPLINICERLTAKNRAERYRRADEVITGLNQWQESGRFRVQETKEPEKISRRNWILAGVVMLLLAGAILLLIKFLFPTRQNSVMGGGNRPASLATPADSTLSDSSHSGDFFPRKTRPKKPINENQIVSTPVAEEPKHTSPSLPAPEGETNSNSRGKVREKDGQFGYFSIQCLPWGKVWIDDQMVGETPFKGPLRLPVGNHRLRVSNPSYLEYQKEIAVFSGDTGRLFIHLINKYGELDLRVLPWARVFIDGTYYDVTPLSKPIPLLPGEHSIRLENPSFLPWEQKISISRGETRKLKVVLK